MLLGAGREAQIYIKGIFLMWKGVFCSLLKTKIYEIQGTEIYGFPDVSWLFKSIFYACTKFAETG